MLKDSGNPQQQGFSKNKLKFLHSFHDIFKSGNGDGN